MFRLFKKKSVLSEERKRMDNLWEKYYSGKLEEENYAIFVLCDYDHGVCREGHSGFLSNNKDRLQRYNIELKKILPDELYANFLKAYQAYGTEHENEVWKCANDFFVENEQRIFDVLQDYVNSTN